MVQQGPVPLGAMGESFPGPSQLLGMPTLLAVAPRHSGPCCHQHMSSSDVGPAVSILQGPCDDTGPTQNPRSLLPSSSGLCKAPLSGSHVCTDRGIGMWTSWGIFIPPPH